MSDSSISKEVTVNLPNKFGFSVLFSWNPAVIGTYSNVELSSFSLTK